jgi:putative redox protein
MSTQPQAPEGWVVVRGAADGFAQTIDASGHMLPADEPTEQGGTATGPTPYDLLLASLGACTSMTVSMYARRKQWPLQHVTVHLRHSRVHAEDCAECESAPQKLDRIERELELRGPLTDDQRARLLSIAERCPVHVTLTSRIDIQTRVRAT